MPTQTSKKKISLFSFDLLPTLGKKLSQTGMETKETWVPSISLTPPQPTDSKKINKPTKKVQHFVTSVHGHGHWWVPNKNRGGWERERGWVPEKKEEDERERESGETRKKRIVDRIIYQSVFASYSSVCFRRFLREGFDGVSPWIFLAFAAFCRLESKRVNPKIVLKWDGFYRTQVL